MSDAETAAGLRVCSEQKRFGFLRVRTGFLDNQGANGCQFVQEDIELKEERGLGVGTVTHLDGRANTIIH